MAKRKFRTPPKFFADVEELIRKVVLQVVTDLLRGKTNNTFVVTLTPSVTTTTLTTELSTVDSEVLLTPKSATAATAIGAGVIWTEPLNGSVVVHHDSDAATDRTFGLAIIG